MLSIAIGVFSVQFLVAFILQLGKLNTFHPLTRPAKSSKITILIPFHNEAKRILPLINALNESKPGKHFELIFIDDHSTDDTVSVIMKKLKVPHQCVHNTLPKGKKYAIKYGVTIAPHSKIITWDADITVTPLYLESISRVKFTDLIILPVLMTSKKWTGKLASIEFAFLQTLGFGMAGFGKPILGYGANLGFKKEAFLEVDANRDDYNQASGDDLFLLKAMLSAKKEISVYSNSALFVNTKAPSKFKKIIQQRQRWFSKMGPLFNSTSLSALILLVVVQIFSVISWVGLFFQPLFWIPLALKLSAEAFASWSFIKQKPTHFFVLIVHQVWYPLYLIMLLFPVAPEPKWKNPKADTAVYDINGGNRKD